MKRYTLSFAAALAATTMLSFGQATPASAETEIRWATSSVGSAGHRALVNLATVLNREWEGHEITVMPMPGAIATVRGYALGEIEGFYGADIAFQEFDEDSGRFTGFKSNAQRAPVQSFWAYTMEIGLAVRAEDLDSYDGWRSMSGKPVFTGPAPWDTRAALERAMNALEVGHEYVELDIGLAGSSLQEGTIDAFSAYTGSMASPAPWVTEAELSTDIAILNPSEEEQDMLQEAGLPLVSVSPDAFQTDVHVDEVLFTQFYYGFHLGEDLSEEAVYNKLVTIEENAEELASTDALFEQIAEDMVGIQVAGIESSVRFAKIHPGLARFMKERDAWNSEWDDRIAE